MRRVPVQDDVGAGGEAGVAVDVLGVDLELGQAAQSTMYWVETPMKLVLLILPVMRLRLSGMEPASSAWVMLIFSGRTPTRTLPPARAGAAQRATGRTSLSPAAFTTTSSAPRVSTSASMRLEVPRKLATKVVRGFSYRSAGAPSCSTRPPFITATWSAMVMASSWSCVTCTKVMPTSVWMRFSSSCIWRRSLRSRAPRGSSRSSTLGWLIRARATATRCCWPPESWCGFLRACSPSWTRSSISPTCFFTLLMPRRRRPKATFSKMSRCGKRA
ncbi:hypothetical protein SROCM77S_05657 [Streptomyces rochei]